jgi:arsenate reductase (glutaredoxin)
MAITIYHNPNCGTSRNRLALIRNAGIEPNIIDYVANPPAKAVLQRLIAAAGLTVRDAVREKGTPYAELGLADPQIVIDAQGKRIL